MTDQEQKEHIQEYSERYRFWANQALSQLGYSINLFTTLGIAFVAFLVKQREDFNSIKIDFSQDVDWSLTMFFFAFAFSLLTVLLGLVAVTARLYDIRITRHLIWTRNRAMKKSKAFLPEGFIGLTKDSKVKNYLHTLTKKISWIETKHIENKKELSGKFENLRKQARLLGELSWMSHKQQLLMLLFALILYVLT